MTEGALDAEGICDLATKDAPAAGITVIAVTVPLCGRAFKPETEIWAPGTLQFVSGQNELSQFTRWATEIRKMSPGPQKLLFLTGRSCCRPA